MDNNNIQNPFIGLRTYEEADAIFFRGRKSSTTDLYSMILDNDIVVFHAESGEGKSSLLNAGLFPKLRDERFFPIKINFTEEDYALESPDFDKIIYQRVVDSVNQINGDSPDTQVFRDTPSLNGKVSILPIDGNEEILSNSLQMRQCAWWLLRNYSLNAYGAFLIPVLVFDQFEEVFTKPKSNIWTEDFFFWLSSTLIDNVPQNVIEMVRESIGENEDFPKVRIEKKFKALFSLRTEYMGELDYWGIQRHHISVLKNSRYCLKPLTELEADEVLELQPMFTSQIRNQIKEAIRSSHGANRVQSNLPAIPAMLLSVVSTTATNSIYKGGQASNSLNDITENDINSDLFTNIIDQFYQKEVVDANIQKKVIKHIENVLVDDKGKRVRIKADSRELREIDFETKYKPLLEEKRLIKCTQINGDEYVELTHDALAKVIANKRVKQSEHIAKVKSWGLYVIEGITFLLGVIFAIGYIDAVYYSRSFLALLFIQSLMVVIACCIIRNIQKKSNRYKILLTGAIFFILTLYGFNHYFPILKYCLKNKIFPAGSMITCICGIMSLIFIIGRYLSYSKKRFLSIIGIMLTLCTIAITAASYGRIYPIAILGIVLFALSPYIFITEKNSGYFLLFASCLMFFSMFIWRKREVGYISMIMGVWFAMLGIIYLSFKKEYTLRHQIELLISGNLKQKFPVIRRAFNLYIITILLIVLVHYIGPVMEPIPSLAAMIISCPILIVSTLELFRKDKAQINILYLCVQIIFVEVCAVLIWISQFTFSHFLIVIGVVLILPIGEILLSLFNKVPFEFNQKISQALLYATSSLFAIFVGSYLVLGYNYFTGDDSKRMYGENIVIRSSYYSDLNFQFVQDKNGKIGLRDRKGKVVIPPMFDDIYRYDYSFVKGHSYYDASNDFNIIFILNGNPIKWNIYDHLHERNDLTDEFCNHSRGEGYEYCSSITPSIGELSVFIGAQKLRENDSSYVRYAERTIMEKITSSINVSQSLNNQKEIKSFNPNDKTHLELLKCISYTQLPWELLPYSSMKFRKQFYNNILPNTNLIETYPNSTDTTEYVLCNIYYKGLEGKAVSHKLLNNISIEKSTGPSEEYLSYRVGDLYAYIAKDEFLSGGYRESISICEKTYNKFLFTEPILPIQIASMILNGDYREAKSLLEINRDELIRINNGLGMPDSSLKNAWYFLQYETCINMVDQLLQLTKRYGLHISNWDKINQLLNEQKQASIYKEFPDYDIIQKTPRMEDKDVLRFVKWDGGVSSEERIYGYSYFVTDGVISSPLISSWCYGGGENDFRNYPFLTIDYTTHKRRFIRAYGDGSLSVTKFHPWDFIGDEYTHAWTFHEGLAAVEIDNKIGFINSDGEIVISPQFHSPYNVGATLGSKIFDIYSSKNHKMPYFKDGICPVYDFDGKLIWIDKSGKRTDAQ